MFRRVPLHRGRAVHALLADPMRPGRILVGADEGVVTVGRGGERSRRAGLRRVRLLAAAGRRVFAASDAGLFLLESRGGARALALRPGQGRGRSIQALATHDPDLYLSGARKLWRLEGDLPVPVAGPAGGPSTALVVCGRRLAAANEGGAWRLGALGWRPLGIAAAVRSLGCIGERIVAATSLGLLVEFRGAGRPVRRRSQPRDLERASVPARLDSPGSLTRRARHAPWLPRLSLLARAVRSRDVHSPETVLLWPAPLSAPPRWNHEPVLRIRTSDRFEVLVLATWPLGAVGPEQTIRIARRVERRHQRLRLWLQRRIALLRQTIRDLPDDGAGTLLAGVQRRLRRAELEALLDGLTGASWERRS